MLKAHSHVVGDVTVDNAQCQGRNYPQANKEKKPAKRPDYSVGPGSRPVWENN